MKKILEIKIKLNSNLHYEEFNLNNNEFIFRFNIPGNFENLYFTIDLTTFHLHAYFRNRIFIYFSDINQLKLKYYI